MRVQYTHAATIAATFPLNPLQCTFFFLFLSPLSLVCAVHAVYALHVVIYELCCLAKPGEMGKIVPLLEAAGQWEILLDAG